MNPLPRFTDASEAIDYYLARPTCTDAEKALVVATLSRQGLSNKAIRQALNINRVYTVTHLKRAGTLLSDTELQLWYRNPTRITLGHVRAVAKLPQPERENLLRDLLRRNTPVHQLESLAQGKAADNDADIARYETLMAEVIGRHVKVQYDKAKRTGSITLDFYTLEDLDRIAQALGFDAEKHL